MRAVLLGLMVVLAGCAAPPPGERPPPPPPPAAPPTAPPPSQADLAAEARAFDGLAAWHLAAMQVAADGCSPAPPGATPLCAWQPRHRTPGSEGSNATAERLAAALRDAGWAVRFEPFDATFEGRALPARNVVADRAGATEALLILGAHYDTRPCADKDPDPANRTRPVLGANDGASGVAVLLHLAQLLEGRAMNLSLRVVFFDAEDMGDAGLGCGRGTPWAQGSEHHAAAMPDEEVRRARGMVLLDMVGDAGLELRREGASAAPPHRALQDGLWSWAARLGHPQFLDASGPRITDDHLPFQQRGIAAVDVIHLDDDGRDVFPGSHHTTFDDLDRLSPASLEAVGETVLAALLDLDARAAARPLP